MTVAICEMPPNTKIDTQQQGFCTVIVTLTVCSSTVKLYFLSRTHRKKHVSTQRQS